LVDELCSMAADGPVAIAVDAPIRAFDGIQAPSTFTPLGAARGRASWPFDVNPFSQRACEKALSSRPKTSSLLARDLAKVVESLCGGDVSFAKAHPGVSVLGCMSAPHAPVVRAFLAALTERAGASGISVDYELGLPASAKTIRVLETHPAVALGFYAAMGVRPFPSRIPVYKGSKANPGDFEALVDAVVTHLNAKHGCTVRRPADDDELDSLVGLLNLLDLAHGSGDFFGTEDGYFLVPAPAEGKGFADVWRAERGRCCRA